MHARRLTTQAQFQAVLACSPVARTEHFVMHRMDLQLRPEMAQPSRSSEQPFAQAGLWLGAMVPKRWARRAVTRNLIKRQIYSLARERLHPGDMAYLVRLRSAYENRQYRSASSEQLRRALRAELEQLYARSQPRMETAA